MPWLSRKHVPLVLLLTSLSIAILAPIVWRYYRPTASGFDISGYQYGRDFINNWVGPRLAFSGRVRQLFDLRDYWHLLSLEYGRALPFHNWSYPPSILLLLLPFACLPYFMAYAAWIGLFFPLYLKAALTFIAADDRKAALVLLALAPASLLNLISGQNGFLTAALLLGGMACLPNRPRLAGVLFGLLTLKPQLGLALAVALIALGAWRTIAAAVLTGCALVLQSILLFGLEPWRLYLSVTSNVQINLLKVFEGFYTPAMVSVMATARFNGVPYQASAIIQAVTTLAVLIATMWAVRRTTDWKLRTLVVMAATPLATPYAFNYDLTALSAMLVWRLTSDTPLTSLHRAVYVLAWLAPVLMECLALGGLGLMAIPLLLAFFACLNEIWEQAKNPAERPSQNTWLALSQRTGSPT